MSMIRSWVALALFALGASGCSKEGVIELHKIPHSDAPAAAGAGNSVVVSGAADSGSDDESASPCPEGWNCMDISAFGMATDGDGKPVKASCSKGLMQTACDDADPAKSCEGLDKPICAHLMIGGQTIVSCAQRCNL